jgi:hypothetical protein
MSAGDWPGVEAIDAPGMATGHPTSGTEAPSSEEFDRDLGA